jgi:hypothetical protein
MIFKIKVYILVDQYHSFIDVFSTYRDAVIRKLLEQQKTDIEPEILIKWLPLRYEKV